VNGNRNIDIIPLKMDMEIERRVYGSDWAFCL